MALADLAGCEVEDIVAAGAEEPLRELVKARVVLLVERHQQPVGGGPRRVAVLRARGSDRGVDAKQPQCRGSAQQVGVVDPAPAVLRGIGARLQPSPERRPVRPLDQDLHAKGGQLGGHRPGHRNDGRKVGLARAEGVEGVAIRVVGEQDGIDVGGDLPGQRRSLADTVVPTTNELRHVGCPEMQSAYGAGPGPGSTAAGAGGAVVPAGVLAGRIDNRPRCADARDA